MWKFLQSLTAHPNWPDRASFNPKVMIILLSATFVICLYLYSGLASFFIRFFPTLAARDLPFASIYPSLYNYGIGFVVLGIFPVLIVKVVLKESLSDYGLQWGDWQFGLKILPWACIVMIFLSYLSSSDPLFQAAYPLSYGAGDSWRHTLLHESGYLFYYLGFEFLFRGFMLFGLRQSLGDWNAIWIQTLASTLIHIGKPMPETFSAILGGIVFGIFVLRCRSLYYQIILHWILGVSLNLFIVYKP